MGAWSRARFVRAATAVLALGTGLGTAADAAPLPAFAGTTVITARGNAGIALSMPRNAVLDVRDRDPEDHAVTIARRGGTYAFVGLSEPDACRRYADPETRMCMGVHGYDFGPRPQRPGMPDDSKHVVTLDPPVVGKGRIEVYVLTDGEVTLTLRFKGMGGTRRVRADRRVTGWMQELPRTCVATCDSVAFGGATHDVGKAGFVAAFATATRDVEAGTVATPLGPLSPGTDYATPCIYRGTDPTEPSPEPAAHPAGCDQTGWMVVGTPGADGSLAGVASLYDYGAIGRVYVGFQAAVVRGTGSWQNITGYGVWVADGLR